MVGQLVFMNNPVHLVKNCPKMMMMVAMMITGHEFIWGLCLKRINGKREGEKKGY
jgi:hypothetical protein